MGFFSQTKSKTAKAASAFEKPGVSPRPSSADSPSSSARGGSPSTFGLLYESHDKIFCLYESRDGHLAAVDARRFV